MRLTKKKSMEICIELWTYLAETGNEKKDWPGWERYGKMDAGCPLCHYAYQHQPEEEVRCNCPLDRSPFNGCYSTYYGDWYYFENDKWDRKKYAGLFLKQLKEIKWG